MKAELGKRYALIQDGRCHWKFDITTLPEWHDGLQVVEISTPEPDEGDLYDGRNFSKPPVVPPAPVRKTEAEALAAALIRKGVVTRAEVEAER